MKFKRQAKFKMVKNKNHERSRKTIHYYRKLINQLNDERKLLNLNILDKNWQFKKNRLLDETKYYENLIDFIIMYQL